MGNGIAQWLAKDSAVLGIHFQKLDAGGGGNRRGVRSPGRKVAFTIACD
jgi:hypothetical protein